MHAAPRTSDVVVVGAGVIGCAIGWRLRKAGLSVRLLERAVPGAEASSVAAGILAPHLEHGAGPVLDLGRASLALYARWADELQSDVGLGIGYRASGLLRIALGEEEYETLAAEAERLAPLAGAELLDASGARALEPALSPALRAALHLPREAQLEPPLLVRALAVAAERAGATFSSGVLVREILGKDRVTGVALADGTEVHAPHVVVAAGAWTALVPGLGALGRAVSPVRGQLVHADCGRPILSRIVFGAGGYVVPRADGRVVCGATMEDAGYASEVTLGGLDAVVSRALRAVPALLHARVTGTGVNFRPASRDEKPLIGPAGPEGLWLASGHFRSGILLAPGTAELVVDQILGRKTTLAVDAGAFDPRRLAA